MLLDLLIFFVKPQHFFLFMAHPFIFFKYFFTWLQQDSIELVLILMNDGTINMLVCFGEIILIGNIEML